MRKWVVGVLVLLVVVFVAIRWLVPTAQDRVDAHVAELRAQGEIAVFAELDAPIPPPSENGAAEFERARDWLVQHLDAESERLDDDWENHYAGPWNYSVVDPWQENTTDEQWAELRSFYESLEPYFEMIDACVAKGRVVWPPTDGPFPSTTFGPEGMSGLSRWQNESRIVYAAVFVASDPNDIRAAIVRNAAFTRLPRPRTAIDHMVVMALYLHALDACREAVESGRVDGADLRVLLAGWS